MSYNKDKDFGEGPVCDCSYNLIPWDLFPQHCLSTTASFRPLLAHLTRQTESPPHPYHAYVQECEIARELLPVRHTVCGIGGLGRFLGYLGILAGRRVETL